MIDLNLPDWTKAELQRLPDAITRGALEATFHAHAVAARYDIRSKRVVVELADGASVAFQPEEVRGLAGASAENLAIIELSPLGTGLHWPLLNADLRVEVEKQKDTKSYIFKP